jgi:hypothetical protein
MTQLTGTNADQRKKSATESSRLPHTTKRTLRASLKVIGTFVAMLMNKGFALRWMVSDHNASTTTTAAAVDAGGSIDYVQKCGGEQ